MSTSSYTPLQQRLGELGLLLVTMIWGSTFILIRQALTGIGPLTLLSIRFTIGFLVLLTLFSNRIRRMSRGDLQAGLILGLMFLSGNVLQTTGLQYTSASVSGFITAMSVVFVPPLALMVLQQRPTKGAVLGVILAVAGLALLTLKEDLTLSYGDLLTLGCAVAFAWHIVYTSKYGSRTEPVAIVAVQLALSALVTGVGALATEVVVVFSAQVWAIVLYLGLLPTAFCFVMQVYGQRRTTATRAALIYTTEPVFATLFAFLLAGELLTERGLVGSALILAGMIAAQLA